MKPSSAKSSLRIVSLAPNATSILCAIGAQRILVGVSKWCSDVAPVRHLPKFGDCWHLDHPERIHALKPDLVIGSVPFRSEALARLLAEPLNFLALNPQTLTDIERDIRQLGGVTGRSAGADRLIQRMRHEFARVAKRAQSQRRLRVYCEAWPNPRIASPPWVAELVHIAGGSFVPLAGVRVTDDEVVQANPNVIILAWTATGRKAQPRQSYAIKSWQNLSAIREHHVFVVRDELLNTPGPPLLQGVRELARILAACAKKTREA